MRPRASRAVTSAIVRGLSTAEREYGAATAFHRLSAEAWDGLEAEARALVAFLAPRDPAVYRRYARWWDGLPGAEVHVLGRPPSN